MPRINQLTSLTTPSSDDVLPIVDVSDTTQSVEGTTKKIAYSLISDAYIYQAVTAPITLTELKTGTILDISGSGTLNLPTSDLDNITIFCRCAYATITLDAGTGNLIDNSQTRTLSAGETVVLNLYDNDGSYGWVTIGGVRLSMYVTTKNTASASVSPILYDYVINTLLNAYTTGNATYTLPSKTIMDNFLGGITLIVKNNNGSARTLALNAGSTTNIEGGNKTLNDGACIQLTYDKAAFVWNVVSTYGTVT